ncbi:MAG: GntR family transcriptional regulator [Opitutales bacterium]
MIETRSVTAQLVELCQRDLATGRWRAGQRFPSERELAAQHGISRTSANKAIAKLVSEGWLEIRRGQGSFVAERPGLLASLHRLESFTEYARAQGFEPETQVLGLQRLHADAEVPASATAFGERILLLERVRLADAVPVIYERRWLPAARYPRLQARQCAGSFYKLCRERFELVATREEAVVRATLPDAAVAHYLDGEYPCLRLESTGYDAQARPLWYQQLHYDGTRFALSTSHSAARAESEILFQS